jgi:hypothetical protein
MNLQQTTKFKYFLGARLDPSTQKIFFIHTAQTIETLTPPNSSPSPAFSHINLKTIAIIPNPCLQTKPRHSSPPLAKAPLKQSPTKPKPHHRPIFPPSTPVSVTHLLFISQIIHGWRHPSHQCQPSDTTPPTTATASQ